MEINIKQCSSRPSRVSPNTRATLALDDQLAAEAQTLTGRTEKSTLVREALGAPIERESARRLARLGGIKPGLEAPRRRTTAAA